MAEDNKKRLELDLERKRKNILKIKTINGLYLF